MSSIRSEIDPEVKGPVICITVWIAMMVFISDGLQGSFGAYIYTYAIKSGNGITPDDAAYLNSLFWVCENSLIAIRIPVCQSSYAYHGVACQCCYHISNLIHALTTVFWIASSIFSCWLWLILPINAQVKYVRWRSLRGNHTAFIHSHLSHCETPEMMSKGDWFGGILLIVPIIFFKTR